MSSSKNSVDAKPGQPKKFVAFSTEDSRAIEATYQDKLVELEGDKTASRDLN
jgi:hypothetical protein